MLLLALKHTKHLHTNIHIFTDNINNEHSIHENITFTCEFLNFFKADSVYSLVECTSTLKKKCSWQKLPPKTNQAGLPCIQENGICDTFTCQVMFS